MDVVKPVLRAGKSQLCQRRRTMGSMVFLISVASFAALALLLGAFAAQMRMLIEPLDAALGMLFQAAAEFARGARIHVWEAVKPRRPVDPLQVLLGLALLGGAGVVVTANYHQLVPTVAFLIPVEGAQTALALAIVVMGTALGALLHAIPERRHAFSGVGVLLVACVGVLNWKRAELIIDGPDLGALLLATLFPVLLQVAELATVFGGLHLAGSILPMFATSPVLFGLGVISTAARLLVIAKLNAALAALLNALTDAGERLFNAFCRVAQWLSPAAFGERRQAQRVRQVRRVAEVYQAQTAIELESQRLRSARDAEEMDQCASATHQRSLSELRRRIEFEAAEAEARADVASESQIHADARSRKMAAIGNVVQKYYGTAERVALEVMDESEPHIKAYALNQVKVIAPESGAGIAAATREVFRATGDFSTCGSSSKNHRENQVDSHKEAVN
jgi:hypothetical protein